MKVSLKQGDLENIILNALWDLEASGHRFIYVGDIQEKIQTQEEFSEKKSWAYTTVKTVLDRLVDKALAERTRQGKKFEYRALLKREEASEQALKKLVQQYFGNDFDRLETFINTLKQSEAALLEPRTAKLYMSKALITPRNTLKTSSATTHLAQA
jgi:predicted transcriptional regulator